MRYLDIAGIAAVVLLANVTQAGVQKAPPDMNRMVKLCLANQEELADAACRAFVSGVVETSRLYATTGQMPAAFCPPADGPPGDPVAVYRAYLSKNMALKHFPAAALAVSAFKEAYPCPQR